MRKPFLFAQGKEWSVAFSGTKWKSQTWVKYQTVVGASLSEPHTSGTALQKCVSCARFVFSRRIGRYMYVGFNWMIIVMWSGNSLTFTNNSLEGYLNYFCTTFKHFWRNYTSRRDTILKTQSSWAVQWVMVIMSFASFWALIFGGRVLGA